MIDSISPIDGRYRKKIEELSEYFSEFALIRNRIKVEVEYLIFLSEWGIIRKLKRSEKDFLKKLYRGFSKKDADQIKKIESEINHDVKAIEYFIRDKIENSSVEDLSEKIHICLTSEDTNNIAYGLAIKEFLKKVFLKEINSVKNQIMKLARENENVVMVARTHGQPAVPTTLGKEYLVFASRLDRQIDQLKKTKITAKLNGAVGNYNAHLATYPTIDWVKFSKEFIGQLGLEPIMITTQIEPRDNLAEIFHNTIRINNILIGLNRNMWTYISMGYLKQKIKEEEVGSSTMPQKVNPINFENSEGNLGIANSLLGHFCNKLTISRMQRDLSDSTVLRNIGVGYAHCIIAYKNTLKGLGKIETNKDAIEKDLESHPEIIIEGIQTILRREGLTGAYEKMKALTRGKNVTKNEIEMFVKKLKIDKELKKELIEINQKNYIGLANRLNKLLD